jgi:hypothetical protein
LPEGPKSEKQQRVIAEKERKDAVACHDEAKRQSLLGALTGAASFAMIRFEGSSTTGRSLNGMELFE